MHSPHLGLLPLVLTIGCIDVHPEDGYVTVPAALLTNCRGTQLPDMTVAPPNCPAAKGLPGDNLLCVDFSKVTSLADPALNGWTFTTGMSGNCAGWQINNSQLQVRSFSGLMGTCGITMPAFDLNMLKMPADQKYQSVTLSLVHTVYLDQTQQQAQIYVGFNAPNKQEAYMTGQNSRQQTVITIARGDLPAAANGVFQPVLTLTSEAPIGGKSGWLIESIAINASP